MSSAGIIIALRHRAERRLADRLRQAGATSAAAAQPLPDLRFRERLRLRRMVAVGAVRETASGTYYLDESVFASYQHRRRRRILVALGGLLAALGVAGLRRR